ncbi:nucleotidyltransferase domain-containing protein [Aliifodinibius sp. S!AR15-10]|uniref:type VII toxin-antitoxin system MntA family adenylyltransferase antitoxin n=1 Tax=Aliifodinibius sp. S!AR15-10 TaxID=2950437 RepID=UPI002865F386|nr:nucleotidyltransferase domain-containing protein [Aliifodinibius sp. S!AR15-10]MDR8392880.1 nucleotidyltransferase domain-containing protein [Aliifodinibius sp. S!AR15-10]
MKADKKESIEKYLEGHPKIKLGILHGSVAENRATFESDIDLAVAADEPLSSDEIMEVIKKIIDISGRPVDLIDLQTTHGTLLKEILTKGTLIYSGDTTLHASIIKRMIFNQEDMMPYRDRILKEQRERWVKE